MLQFFQIAVVSSDLARSLRFYGEVFGYRHAGSQGSWGSKIQGLGQDSCHLMWWVVGDQGFFQLELFQYSRPVSRPLPKDWRPSDHGWTRFGVIVADFDQSLRTLQRHEIEPLAPPVAKDGRRHIAIRDPFAGTVIELIESDQVGKAGPTVAYVTSSVSDLISARTFYEDVLELKILPLERLHSPADEALWGLAGATRDGFLVEVDSGYLEIVCYSQPLGRRRPPDHRLSDHGIQNISLGSRKRDVVSRLLDRVQAAGYSPPFIFENGENICGYINDAEREFEFASIPESMDEVYGFAPAKLDFFGKRNMRLWDPK